MEGNEKYSVSPEDLHNVTKDGKNPTSPEFVNPGTSKTPFMDQSQLDRGRIGGTGTEDFKAQLLKRSQE